MRAIRIFLGLFVMKAVEAGYKVRPPPPPPVPPASVHYGPRPPSHYHHPHHKIYPPHPPPPPPPHSFSHPHSHLHKPKYHVPRIPYKHKSSSRELQRYAAHHSFGPQFVNYNPWKNYNTFRAPVVKESFNYPVENPSPSYHTSLINDNDKGPIHTIPAPNLGPSDAHFNKEFHYHKQDPESDLVAVLKHGISKVNIPHPHGYQVTEDPSLHTPYSGSAPYFAPDPDPSIPSVKVAATTDPHSIPSNGQVPLDLYIQQQEEKKQVEQQEAQNALTAQDLFNLLNYEQGASVNYVPVPVPVPVAYDQQLYTPGLGSVNEFKPDFQTFNYEEQTKQADGISAFAAVNEYGNLDSKLLDNDIAGSEKDQVFYKPSENELTKSAEPPKKTNHNKDYLAKNQSQNTKKKSLSMSTETSDSTEASDKVEEDQKTVEMSMLETKEENGGEEGKKTGRNMSVFEVFPEELDPEVETSSSLPYGTRLRPKRY